MERARALSLTMSKWMLATLAKRRTVFADLDPRGDPRLQAVLRQQVAGSSRHQRLSVHWSEQEKIIMLYVLSY